MTQVSGQKFSHAFPCLKERVCYTRGYFNYHGPRNADRERRVIWDFTRTDHMNLEKKDQAWESVALELALSLSLSLSLSLTLSLFLSHSHLTFFHLHLQQNKQIIINCT